MNTDLILVLDFGGDQAYYTARRLRGEQFYCELLPAGTPLAEIKSLAPKGVILAGGEAEAFTGEFDAAAYGVPVLALGGAARILAKTAGALHQGTQLQNSMDGMQFSACDLFAELNQCDRMFERVDAFELPEGYTAIATTQSGLTPGFACLERQIYGIQFYVESNDPEGLKILENFAEHICGCPRSWTVEKFAPALIESVRKEVADRNVLLPVFGGPETAVAAALLHRAIGSRLSCLFIDTGLLRKGEPESIRKCFFEQMGLSLTEIDASERFLKALIGVSSPDEKRRIMHEEYFAVFTEQYIKSGSMERVAEGTSYSDILKHKQRAVPQVIEGCALIEPLRRLFKDDIRMLGRWLNVPEDLLNQPSFEFCGLSVRCLGEVTRERLSMLRSADAVFIQEVDRAGLSHRIAQYFAILTDIRTPGLHGEGYVCALRALGTSSAGRASAYKLPYDLMDAVVRRITGEIPGITHVVYDITGRPIAAVEWE